MFCILNLNIIILFFRKKSDKVRKELEEAAREGCSRGSDGSGGSVDDKIMDSMPYYATTLPTKVLSSFVSTILTDYSIFKKFYICKSLFNIKLSITKDYIYYKIH